MENVIKFLAHYDTYDNEKENRAYHLAACAKLNYIFECLLSENYSVDILSACYTRGKKYVAGHRRTMNKHMCLRLLACFGMGNSIKRKFSLVFFNVLLFFNLLFFVRRGEILWVYHSLGLIRPVSLLKKIKGFRLILEVEEVYGDVIHSKKKKEREFKFFNLADAFVFPSELLNEKINQKKKPYAVSYGTYHVVEGERKHDDLKTHVIYAGTLDPRMGSKLAVQAAIHLPQNYHLHICGGGTVKEIQEITELIKNINEGTKATVTYDGVLKGEAFEKKLQMCDIGLCPHDPDAKFCSTSFPSKILTYMACGLLVVSSRIEPVMKSKINQYIKYYVEQTPESLALAIAELKLSDRNINKNVVRKLDREFIKAMKSLLKSI